KNSNYFRINDILNEINIYNVNFLDENEVNVNIEKIQPEIIFHLATAGAAVGKDPITIQELYNFNVLGTINLINACKKCGFEYFINTGSSSEYGQKDLPMNENDILEPNNDYGVTKASTSMYCKYIGEREKLPIYTFRLFSPYGYYEEKRRLIPTLILNYIHGIQPNLSTPNSVRDYIFIEDVVNYYLNIDKIIGDFGGIYNIANGKQYSIGQIVEIIKKISNSDKEPIYGNSIKQNEPKYRVSDNKKILATFGFKQTSIEIGLQKIFEWFKKNQNLYI
ncbi:MAG: NAD-dependent epimerase/dehydratase family protein, partial [Candidatus Absconditabacteria bacterium]|nr:NAD-dependent epimerase/dehydratase family protein [Candidatus Absconditabacteria bacterium]